MKDHFVENQALKLHNAKKIENLIDEEKLKEYKHAVIILFLYKYFGKSAIYENKEYEIRYIEYNSYYDYYQVAFKNYERTIDISKISKKCHEF